MQTVLSALCMTMWCPAVCVRECICAAAGEAVSHTEKAVQVAGAVHGRDHPVMESYWQAVAEAKQAVRFCPGFQFSKIETLCFA